KLLQLVAHQVLLAVSPPWVRQETEVTLSCGGTRFTVKGTYTTQPGWRTYQPSEEKALPQLTQGQELTVDHAEVKEGVTKPPAHYTEASLLAAMEQAGRQDQPEDAQRRGIGTAATRAGILERL